MIPKAVYWDMDGTLIDSEPLHERALVAALRGAGIEPPADLHARVVGQAAKPVHAVLRDQFGLGLDFDEWIALKYDYYMDHAPSLLPREGALEIFRDLKARGVVQAIVSNSDRMVIDVNLRAVGIHEPTMKTISRNDVRNGKPDPEPYLRAAWLTEIDPADTVVMEDSVTGATAGVAAGMRTIFWPQDNIEGPAGALVAHSAQEVRALLGLD
ncbi:HAD family phosphatase [Aminobacter sp. AP02]|uniref:HAD family hydrolase n=1 Tax=Aminobacter sp. AP02 TaxID=2135737 RepID=UPI000D6B7356|nr:HAD family phosphatase [Aminobacter sp. AP02]PWK70601.1 HAD superfamily hydrolase (TIGR01509 family) [Aminobacter sp. AP02]